MKCEIAHIPSSHSLVGQLPRSPITIMLLGVSIVLVQDAGCFAGNSLEKQWSYSLENINGPDRWHVNWPICSSGHRQAPIDLSEDVVIKSFDALWFHNYNTSDNNLTIETTGQTIRVHLADRQASIGGGGLPGTYIADHMVFHWGASGMRGSEHAINGFDYAMEMQIVHYSARYSSLEAALIEEDNSSVAILSILIDESESGAEVLPALDTIASRLAAIAYAGTTSSVTGLSLADLLPPTAADLFYRYEGSMTTPGCEEKVVWTVFAQSLTAPSAQVDQFRNTLYNAAGEPLLVNSRPRPPRAPTEGNKCSIYISSSFVGNSSLPISVNRVSDVVTLADANGVVPAVLFFCIFCVFCIVTVVGMFVMQLLNPLGSTDASNDDCGGIADKRDEIDEELGVVNSIRAEEGRALNDLYLRMHF